jgi:hypothetical protein
MQSEVYKRNVGTREDLLARISDAAAGIKNAKRNSYKKNRHFRPRVANCIDVDGGIFDFF